jgi:hypothetical protein
VPRLNVYGKTVAAARYARMPAPVYPRSLDSVGQFRTVVVKVVPETPAAARSPRHHESLDEHPVPAPDRNPSGQAATLPGPHAEESRAGITRREAKHKKDGSGGGIRVVLSNPIADPLVRPGQKPRPLRLLGQDPFKLLPDATGAATDAQPSPSPVRTHVDDARKPRSTHFDQWMQTTRPSSRRIPIRSRGESTPRAEDHLSRPLFY